MRITAANYWLARALRALTKWHHIPQMPRERACRLLFHPERMASFGFCVPLHGMMYEGDFAIYQDWRVFFLGSFERETINLLTHILASNPGSVFLDIGANKGLFSAALARHCRRVHAFEPYPPIFGLLERLLSRNKISNVTTHMIGLGEAKAVLPYFPPGGSNIGVGSFVKEHQADPSVSPVELAIERGDDVLASESGPVAALKIDTEGFEGFALAGLRGVMERDRPFAVVEISQTTATHYASGEDFARLFPRDYLFFSISDHTTHSTWRLKSLDPSELLSSYGNILACPKEKYPQISFGVEG